MTDLVDALADGTSMLNPGWTVSLFSLLAPDDMPDDLAKRLPRLVPEMVTKGLLDEIEDTQSGQTVYGLQGEMRRMYGDPSSTLHFGLAVNRLVREEVAEFSVLGGWCSPAGIYLADVSDMRQRGVTLLYTGPELATTLIDECLNAEELAPPWEDFSMETPFTRDRLLSLLREERPPAAGPKTCTYCGKELAEDALFCRSCGKPVERAAEPEARDVEAAEKPSFCSYCGKKIRPGARFCRNCGKAVK